MFVSNFWPHAIAETKPSNHSADPADLYLFYGFSSCASLSIEGILSRRLICTARKMCLTAAIIYWPHKNLAAKNSQAVT